VKQSEALDVDVGKFHCLPVMKQLCAWAVNLAIPILETHLI
jgi:hypothetical protein